MVLKFLICSKRVLYLEAGERGDSPWPHGVDMLYSRISLFRSAYLTLKIGSNLPLPEELL